MIAAVCGGSFLGYKRWRKNRKNSENVNFSRNRRALRSSSESINEVSVNSVGVHSRHYITS